ncbi:MAG: SusD/RagB family nutrient-binding outer membrane lipoprotein, partial [Cyclobacteriaceae bacterium]|nr:SusD/RagB family nutrient-binding outer membrane lipoprotein [Cyclobacteriaceae bacterium]
LHVTDRFGDIPYSQALQAPDILAPVFDEQSAVYSGVFNTLSDAVSMMDAGAGPTGDIMLGGDMAMWAKFANTMRLVAALRLSNVDPTKGSAEFNAAMAAGVIATDNSENITYQHLADANNQNPWYGRFLTRKDYTLANTLVDYMHSTANGGMMNVAMDPRLPVFGDGTESSGGTEIVGMVYGISEADAGAISNEDVSFLGAKLQEQDAPTYIYTAAQVLFSMAEAVELGWISGDTEQFYNDAIQASLDQYGVGAGYADYMLNTEVAFDSNRALEQIGNQKWVALFLNGYEGWAEWRRTGYPALEPAVAAQNPSGEIPVRQAYPTWEPDLNGDNYAAVVARQGEDGLDTKVWWDQ